MNRYPANPRQPGDYRGNPPFDPNRAVGTVTWVCIKIAFNNSVLINFNRPPGMNPNQLKSGPSDDGVGDKKSSAKRQRRPRSRKSSRDGDENSSSENNQRKRKRNTKDDSGIYVPNFMYYLCTYNITRTTTRHDGCDRAPIRPSLAISSRALKLRENQNKGRWRRYGLGVDGLVEVVDVISI